MKRARPAPPAAKRAKPGGLNTALGQWAGDAPPRAALDAWDGLAALGGDRVREAELEYVRMPLLPCGKCGCEFRVQVNVGQRRRGDEGAGSSYKCRDCRGVKHY